MKPSLVEQIKALPVLNEREYDPTGDDPIVRVPYVRLADVLALVEAAEPAIRRDQLRQDAAWMQHGIGCAAWPSFPSHFTQASKVGECTCGLSAHLKDLEP